MFPAQNYPQNARRKPANARKTSQTPANQKNMFFGFRGRPKLLAITQNAQHAQKQEETKTPRKRTKNESPGAVWTGVAKQTTQCPGGDVKHIIFTLLICCVFTYRGVFFFRGPRDFPAWLQQKGYPQKTHHLFLVYKYAPTPIFRTVSPPHRPPPPVCRWSGLTAEVVQAVARSPSWTTWPAGSPRAQLSDRRSQPPSARFGQRVKHGMGLGVRGWGVGGFMTLGIPA